MNNINHKEKISAELKEVLTGLLLEVFAGVTKKDEALALLTEMKAQIIPALQEIEETAKQVENY